MASAERRAGAASVLSPAVLLLAAGPVLAQTEDFAEVDGVEVVGRCPWPDYVSGGYVPLLIDVSNPGDEARDVSLRATRGYSSSVRIDAAVTVGAGERVRLELAAPVWPGPDDYWYQRDYDVEIEVGRRSSYLQDLGAQEDTRPEMRAGIVVSRDLAEVDFVEGWEAELSTEEVDFGDVWTGSGSERVLRGNVSLTSVPFELLPTRWEAYTSLDLVLLDARGGLPDAARLEPVFAWTRAGGTLLVLGTSDAASELAELEAAAGWLEPRFLVEDLGDARVHRFGLGHLVVPSPDGGAGPFPGRAGRAGVAWALDHEARDLPGRRTTPGDVPRIPGLGDLPFRTFAVLLVLFALAIGPLNFALVKRVGRPALLLLTIPGTAAVAAALLFGYGVVYQGLDVKTASQSVALLDQRAHRSTSAEVREVFVGLTPGGGLRPGPGTAVLGVEEMYGSASGATRFRLHEGGGTRLSGRFLPARVPVDQVVLTDRSARLRLDVRRSADAGVQVTNGLDAVVEELQVSDDTGTLWRLEGGALAPGATTLLKPHAATAARGEAGESLDRAHDRRLGRAPATFAARVRTNPTGDACGLSPTEVFGEHHLFGVLDASAEAWR